ncbi:NAD(+)--rifampin ADP-ribosyltransferase [Pseudoroseicyclus sp. CXY001]|uniref:NAD(+)--rifampin ADP-ribosyltransferase n=1 Tax=Pseudoroseicyclus sp. CXY001 TaxID=3242492 RepID=UPI00358DD75D
MDAADDKAPDGSPFYHGTRAELPIGALLTPGRPSNIRPEIVMRHIYFTALTSTAALAACLCPGEGRPRVYLVAPTGAFEDDPNVTDKKFHGNPTRSYRSGAPLRILGEAEGWTPLTQEEIAAWRARIAASDGAILN